MAENRMKMHAKETPWGKYLRLNELARHRARCRKMKPSIDASPPFQSHIQIMNRERSDIEQGTGSSNPCLLVEIVSDPPTDRSKKKSQSFPSILGYEGVP